MKKALLRWMNLILVLPLAASVNFVRADDGFYVIAVGKRAKRTILVSPQSTQTASGTVLLNAVNGITDASATNPYLVIIEPGIYDIGANSLQMQPYVDLQGSGEKVTKIKGNVDNDTSGVLRGADNSELRFLCMKVPSVIPAQAGIQAIFAGFRLKACRNDDAKVPKTFILRCDYQVMAVSVENIGGGLTQLQFLTAISPPQ